MTPVRLVSIVIPVYNEVRTVPEVVGKIASTDVGAPKEVILVDDGSNDGTPEALERLAARHGGLVRTETAERHQGKGAAVRRGLAIARGDVILIHDADLELAATEIPSVVAPFFVGGTSVVYGSRFLAPSGSFPRVHVWANRFLTRLTNALFDSRLTDMETACKAFRREVVLGLDLRSKGFEIEPEITAKLLRAGYRIREVPVSYFPRSASQGKKVSWGDGLLAIYTLLKCRLER